MDIIITEKKPTICLNMIVKNESHIIEKTLEKLCNKIKFDYWVICDTGSTDNTPELIINFFNNKSIKGELHHDEWVNFAHNRTLALQKAFKKTELLLVFDADDEIVGNINLPDNVLFDEYHLKFGSPAGVSYTRVLLINNYKQFEYLSVIHEFISCKEPGSKSCVIEGDYFVVSGRSGSRNQDPDKYLKDALILEKAHEEALKNNDQLFHRYAYYCANSYKDSGKFEEAIKWYIKTINQEKQWSQEKYTSCLYIYDCFNHLHKPEMGFFYLVKAFAYDVDRVECLYPLLVHYCCENMHRVAYHYYLNVKDYYENRYLEDDISKKLFVIVDKYNFFVPYYMILIADKVQDFKCVVRMYEIIFIKKQCMFEEWYIKNLLYNLQFFIQHVPESNKEFIPLANSYFKFLYNNGVNFHNFDFLSNPVYTNSGIQLDYIFLPEVADKVNKFTDEECKQSKNILIYTGFSDIEWNYTYMLENALGGSEKAVAYLSNCFPKDNNIYISGHVKNEKIGNIQYIHLDQLTNLSNTIPFHTVIVSRYISFYEMFKECSFYQSFIWAHDVLLLPYGSNLKENQILQKWNKYITGCVCLTEWHRDLFLIKYPELKEKIHIINNGITNSLFKSNFSKIPNKFIYSSRPDRGLNVLLDLWPKILENIPDATLTISTYGAFPKTPEELILKNRIDQFVSINYLGKLNSERLYEQMASAEYWLYPTCWPETSCITALEMLRSEVICLYYPVAGLINTVDKYGIQVKSNTEIDAILNLTNGQKSNLKKNGREYADSCTWENRFNNNWKVLLSLNHNESKLEKEKEKENIILNENIKVESNLIDVLKEKNENVEQNLELEQEQEVELKENIIITSPKKIHIALFNSFEFHYEMIGYIIHLCLRNNYLLTIFTSFQNTLGWLDFYSNHFKNLKFDCNLKTIPEFERERDIFDIIFITTDDDYAFKNEWINDKCISINHKCMVRRPQFKHNLATRPFIKNYKKWAIPCYPILEKNNKENLSSEFINVSIIGGNNDYNYNTINRLSSSRRIILNIIARYANCFNVSHITNKNINVVLHNNIDTRDMINLLKKCDYIFSDSTYNIHHINGISMSGSIPLAFSTLTPLIISKSNNKLYKFKNVIQFELSETNEIVIEKDTININNLINEREYLIKMLDNYVDSIFYPNKNTALIVDPRNIVDLPYLINDFKKKLGENWKVVFYCGKGESADMQKYIDKEVEIRELNVNNFTLDEYSDFMKQKTLWESLYGDFVLTFQADTFIINQIPYNINYFMSLNKSYIGGNMDHDWQELKRENLYPTFKNFNGGLSLRKRVDMIQIIDKFGIEKTQPNSSRIQTDPEDVYFTIGCYKLNLPIGDSEECMYFSINRIWVDNYFGIHKPIPQVLENNTKIKDIYCQHTNTFKLKPKKQTILLILPHWYNSTPLEDYFDSLRETYNIKAIVENQELTDFNFDKAMFICIFSDHKMYNILKQLNIEICLFNTEPMNLQFRFNNLKSYIPSDLGKNAKIYDYSLSNIQIMNNDGYLNTHHLPYQIYDKENKFLTELYKNTKKEYDFGIISYENPIILEKRKNVVKFLIENKYTVNIIHGWKEKRDQELAKCTVILNIHGQAGDYDSLIFEHIRCDRLLEAGFKILSEDCYLLDQNIITKYPNLKLIPFNDFFNIKVINDLNWLSSKSIKIIDCFTFYNELDMLTYRLNVLNDVVDYFILVEARQTHVGKEKILYFNDNKHLFKKFNDKIIHIVVDLPYNELTIEIAKNHTWVNEKYQRECIDQGLNFIKNKLLDKDYIIISDLDEIPDPDTLTKIKNESLKIDDINSFNQDFYYYNLHSKRNEMWIYSKILSYKKYKELNINCSNIRFYHCPKIENGGWHLSYFGDNKFIKNKLENFAHQEFNSDTYTNLSTINEKIKEGLDLFNRQTSDTMHAMTKIPIENNNYLPPLYQTYLSAFYEKSDIPPKIYCFIHSCTLKQNETKILDYLIKVLEKTGFINTATKIFINNIGFPIMNDYGNKKYIITNCSDNKEYYEAITLNKMHDFAKENPNSYILYLHTKGISYDLNSTKFQNVFDWINLMLYFLVEKYNNCINKLDDGYDTVGCNYYEFLYNKYPPHYSGNFWWSKSSHIIKLDKLNENLFSKPEAEFWLFYKLPNFYNIYSSNTDQYIYPFPMDNYSKHSIIEEIALKFNK
jgi:hypothetical protein